MSALTTDLGVFRQKSITPSMQSLQARINVTFRPGALVAHRVGSNLLEVPLSASKRTDLVICGTYVGKSKFISSASDDGNGGALDADGVPQMLAFEPGVTGWFDTGTSSNELLATDLGKLAYAHDDNTVYKTDETGATSPAGRVTGIGVAGTLHADKVEIYIPQVPFDWAFENDADALVSFEAVLLGTSAAEGASIVGLRDAGGFTSAVTVEAAVAELYQHTKSVQKQINIPLTSAIDATTGALLAVFADGATTTPGTQLTNSKAVSVRWNNHATPGAIAICVPLPQGLDDTANVVFHALVSKTGATSGDATKLTVGAFEQVVAGLHDADTDFGGDTDAVVGTATAKTVTEITFAFVAADIHATPGAITLTIKPKAGTLGTDDLLLHACWLEYKGALLTA